MNIHDASRQRALWGWGSRGYSKYGERGDGSVSMVRSGTKDVAANMRTADRRRCDTYRSADGF